MFTFIDWDPFDHHSDYLEPDRFVPFFREPGLITDDSFRMLLRLLLRINTPDFDSLQEHHELYVDWLVDCVRKRILKIDAFVFLIELYSKQSFVRPFYLLIRKRSRDKLLLIPFVRRHPHLL